MPTKPTRLTIYNHKGGVGKTTLTVNIAAALSELGKTVLLVDSDPQCNLTSYLLSDDFVDDLLDKSDTEGGSTLWSAVKPLCDGTGPQSELAPYEVGELLLVPGDIRLSNFEEFLGESWTDSFKRRLGGLRATAAISSVVSQITSDYEVDFVFYDTGPNIGPLNRSLLLDSDYFIVPVACDLFSVRALNTLGQSMKRWIIDYGTIRELAPDSAPLLKGAPRFLGYVPQNFKVYGQEMAREPRKYLFEIRKKMYANVLSVLREVDQELAPASSTDPLLGKIKNFSALVQSGQREGVATWKSEGGSQSQRDEARKAFYELASAIIDGTKSTGPKRIKKRVRRKHA